MILYGLLYSVNKGYEQVYKRLKELLPVMRFPRFHIYIMQNVNKRVKISKIYNSLYDSGFYNYFRTHLLIRHSSVLNSAALEKIKQNLIFQKY